MKSVALTSVARVVALLAIVFIGGSAVADESVKIEISKKVRAGMQSYDLLDYERAEELLLEAASLGISNSMDDPIVAESFLDLGILYFSGIGDTERASQAIAKAVELNNDIEIPLAYRSAELEALMIKTREDAGIGARDAISSPPPEATVEEAADEDCLGIEGLVHERVESVDEGDDLIVSARLGEDVEAEQVVVYFRSTGDDEFTSREMKKDGACRYEALVEIDEIEGDMIYYYVAALSPKGKEIASEGSAASPNPVDIENLSDDDSESGDLDSVASKPTAFLGMALGTGLGLVSGQTEVESSQVECCVAPEYLHLIPEIGFYLTTRTTLSAKFRAGFPLGANVMGHARFAPAVLLRLRHTLKSAGRGFSVSALLGGGVIRHTVKLRNPSAVDMDTDTTAMGPFLVGAGLGYIAKISGPLSFMFGVNVIGALKVGVSELGDCSTGACTRLNTGANFDINMGIMVNL